MQSLKHFALAEMILVGRLALRHFCTHQMVAHKLHATGGGYYSYSRIQ